LTTSRFTSSAGQGSAGRTVTSSECLELPRPASLLRAIGWNLAESFGLPTGAYVLAAWLGGRDAGLWAMLAAIWLTAGVRKFVTKSVPGLVMISLIVLTVQALAAIITGNLWIFLLHFPLANLGLCIMFARTASGRSPIAARLAAEVVGLRCPACHQQGMHRFFQGVTVLWASVFLLLAVSLGALLATIPIGVYVPVWAITTIGLIAAGIGVSVWWLRLVIRRLGIGFRFASPAGAGTSLALPALFAWPGALLAFVLAAGERGWGLGRPVNLVAEAVVLLTCYQATVAKRRHPRHQDRQPR
jgi:hypothetical protein